MAFRFLLCGGKGQYDSDKDVTHPVNQAKNGQESAKQANCSVPSKISQKITEASTATVTRTSALFKVTPNTNTKETGTKKKSETADDKGKSKKHKNRDNKKDGSKRDAKKKREGTCTTPAIDYEAVYMEALEDPAISGDPIDRITEPDLMELVRQQHQEVVKELELTRQQYRDIGKELESYKNKVAVLYREVSTTKEEVQQVTNERDYLNTCVDARDEEIKLIRNNNETLVTALERNKQELEETKDSRTRLELMVLKLSDKPAVPDCQATCKKDTEAVDALVKLVRLLPKAKERKTSKFSSAIKAVMRRVQHFIGPRWKEFARVIDLPLEVIETIEACRDQRPAEIYWKVMTAWHDQECVTLTTITSACQKLGINIYTDKPMSEEHKRLLDRYREQLIHDVYAKVVLNHMLKYLAIPGSLKDHVKFSELRSEQAERLLDILPVLGDQALPVFILALDNTGHHHVADWLIEKPMAHEHRSLLKTFRQTVIRYSDADRILPALTRYVSIPGSVHRYVLEAKTRDDKMGRLLDVLPGFGHTAMEVFIKSLDDSGCKQLSSILKDKTKELQRLRLEKVDTSTQMSVDDVSELAQEPKAPLTGHRRPGKSKEKHPTPDSESDDALWQDANYVMEMSTKEKEAYADLNNTTIEQQVDLSYRDRKPIEILTDMGMVRVRYSSTAPDIE